MITAYRSGRASADIRRKERYHRRRRRLPAPGPGPADSVPERHWLWRAVDRDGAGSRAEAMRIGTTALRRPRAASGRRTDGGGTVGRWGGGRWGGGAPAELEGAVDFLAPRLAFGGTAVAAGGPSPHEIGRA